MARTKPRGSKTRPRFVWLVGAPGAGKTTVAKSIRRKHARKSPTTESKWNWSDMGTQALANEMGKQQIRFQVDAKGKYVELGCFEREYVRGRHGLIGTDLYSPPMRTRVKTVLTEMARRKQVTRVFCEGLTLYSKPFIERVVKHFDVRVVQLATPLDVCEKRWRARNTAMVKRGVLQRVPPFTKVFWEGWAKKLEVLKATPGVEVVELAKPKEAEKRLLELLA